MPYSYITVSGVIIPDTVTTRLEVEEEYKTAFGADLIVTPDTPQGVLITSETLARDAVARNNATLANQINPNIAGGVFLDAILALTGAERTPEVFSSIPGVVLTGVAGTSIPVGVIAQVPGGPQFASETTVTLDGSGNATVAFRAVVPGPVSAAANTLTEIITDVLGWETVNNPNAASLGAVTQSDESARLFRRQTLALQGQGLAESIYSGLRATPGVRSLTFLENVSSSTVVIQGVTLAPHSMWACIDGGDEDDIANTLTNKKNGGCGYNGAVIVPVTNEFSGQVINVQYDVPDLVPVLVRVTIPATTSVADPVGTVSAAILAYAAGLLNSESGFVVGAQVSPFELAGAITSTAPTIFISNLEVSYASPVNYVNTTLFINIFEQPTIDAGSITVIVV